MASPTPTNAADDADPERAAPNILDTTPENQAPTFRNQDQVWPVRVIRRGDAVRPLPPHARSLADLTFEVGGVRLSLSDYMARRRTAGLLILKHGEIALERYGMGNGPESRWTSFSTAKSITATLVGAALHDGAIGSLDDRCEQYLPRLRGSAYEGVTIRNVLRMCSGVAWREENDADGRSEVCRLGQAMVSRRPGAVLDLLCKLPRAQPQGAVFNYSTGESCLLARAGRGRHGPAPGRLLRRDDLGTCRHGGRRVLATRVRGRHGAGRVWRQRAPARLRPLRPAGAGGRRSVQWPTGAAARLARSRRTARQRAHCLRSAHARFTGGIRLSLVGGAALAGRRQQRCLFGEWRLWPDSSSSIRPSRWSLQSRARGVSLRTATPRSKSSR